MSNNLALFIGWLKDNDIDFEFISTVDSGTLMIRDDKEIFYPNVFNDIITEYQMRATRESYGLKFYSTKGKFLEILIITNEGEE